MADEQKPVEAPKEAPVTETPAEETKAEDKPAEAEASAAAEASTEAAPAAEEKKEEVVPVEEGTLDHKSAEAKLPKNFLYSKEAFWFGSDAVEKEKLSSYVKTAKNVDVAQKNASWAASTGKGLLFVGPKDAPTGVINLAEAGDVATDGPSKFHFSASGFKHTFKAASKAEAENWVSQLKLKIEAAKASKDEVVATDAYKQALESFKPAKKEEVVAEPAKEEAKTEDEVPKADEAKEEAAKEEAKAEEPAKEEVKSEETKEEPKRRSASRKRESFMGFLKKKEKKEESKPAEEAKTEDKPAEAAATETPAEAAAETPAPAATEEPAAEPAAATEDKAEEPKEKPAVQKRGSIFASLLGKKEKKPEEPAKEEAKADEPAPTSETAPIIPPVEATTPLDTGLTTAGTVPTETTEVAPATNGESKKEMKSEKRKSSIPFFGHKEKSEKTEAKSDGEEKTEKMSPFSKIRATIKGRTKAFTEKSEEKPAEKTEDKAVETETAVVAAKEEAPKPAEEEPINKPEPAAATAPAVTAAA